MVQNYPYQRTYTTLKWIFWLHFMSKYFSGPSGFNGNPKTNFCRAKKSLKLQTTWMHACGLAFITGPALLVKSKPTPTTSKSYPPNIPAYLSLSKRISRAEYFSHLNIFYWHTELHRVCGLAFERHLWCSQSSNTNLPSRIHHLLCSPPLCCTFWP